MPEPKLPAESRAFDPRDPDPCQGCSNCCEYVSLEIDKPTTLKDFDQILWYVLHKDVWVYIDEDNDWYIQFNTPCEKLDLMRCGYYKNRPQICRDYSPADCLRYSDGPAEKFLFKNENDLFSYLKKKRPVMYKKLQKNVSR